MHIVPNKKPGPTPGFLFLICCIYMAIKKHVTVSDMLQKKYHYVLVEPTGKNFDSRFVPDLTPKQMLALGVFGGYYLLDCQKEFPKDWFARAKMSTTPDATLNFFGVRASQPLTIWQKNGWIYKDDPRGWFQWYCRYYLGRRIPTEDDRQIKRWVAIRRHISQLQKNCRRGDFLCRPIQRQAILHWAYDSRKL